MARGSMRESTVGFLKVSLEAAITFYALVWSLVSHAHPKHTRAIWLAGLGAIPSPQNLELLALRCAVW